jgi:hypothetical protein
MKMGKKYIITLLSSAFKIQVNHPCSPKRVISRVWYSGS